MSSVQTFCRQVRARSAEHRDAIQRLASLPGQIVPILRQELDSLIRVIFLLAQRDRQYRDYLIDAAVNGRQWTTKGSRKRLTDREMVDLANGLHGWAESVYRFGCGFIHLSNLHDYRNRDPLQELPDDERTAVLGHLRYYHGGLVQESPTFDDIVPFLPQVFEKVAGNLECYLREIENDGDLDDHAV
jgi:hypothetical protein